MLTENERGIHSVLMVFSGENILHGGRANFFIIRE
jgi:hypothetical protein